MAAGSPLSVASNWCGTALSRDVRTRGVRHGRRANRCSQLVRLQLVSIGVHSLTFALSYAKRRPLMLALTWLDLLSYSTIAG
jgi:hypothetical protein